MRRTLVAVVAIAVVAAVVWFVVGRGKGSGVQPASDNVTTTSGMTGVLASDSTSALPESSASESAGATSTAATSSTRTTASTSRKASTTRASTSTKASTSGKTSATTKTSATKATTTPPPKPSYDSQGRLLCPDSAIDVRATVGQPSYPVGSQPILGMTVTNTGSKPCVRDLSGTLQVYTVYTKAGARVWSTSDCFPGQGSDVRQLDPHQTVAYNIKWSGTTSTPGCATPRVAVKAGSYTVVSKLGSIASAPKAFSITG